MISMDITSAHVCQVWTRDFDLPAHALWVNYNKVLTKRNSIGNVCIVAMAGGYSNLGFFVVFMPR
jgi:hypothetical protein